ncbi:hypothetical protein HMI54_005866 [Coelomomyces lativittatus]|nr:hypothetical protein HMI56_001795 [Coelomomyces lativittatus]KAJ1505549.1 hypothetical protein HMI54_005866 [Coelomomyces lativittatus]KAJ1508832.1 hypothetical protein HMI55_000212 [Coelomomyces lativittatus]
METTQDPIEQHTPSLHTTKEMNMKAGLVTAGVGATIGAIKATVHELPLGSAIVSMGLAWGATGFLYFATRSKLDRWVSPFLPTTAPYSIWYPTGLAFVSGFTSGVTTTLFIRRPLRNAVNHGLSLAILTAMMQCGWSHFGRSRQNILFREFETQMDWKAQWHAFWTSPIKKWMHWTEQTPWLPIRFISKEEHLHQLAIELAKTQHAMQKYEFVLETLKNRILELKKLETLESSTKQQPTT